MAFKKTVTTSHGIEVKDAYHRVDGVKLASKDRIQFQLRSSVDGVLPHFSDAQFECAYDMNGANPIAQAYVHIKSLPKYADAQDC
jgi:hypothetical protein